MEISSMKTVQLLESIFNNTPDAIDVFDIDNRIVMVNPAFEKIYGWTATELIGQPIPIIPEHLLEETYDLYNKIQAGKTISDYITVRKRKDGSLLTVSLTISPVKNENGEIVAKAAITRDVTEYYNMITELREINESHNIITNNMTDVVTMIDLQGNFLYMSPSYEKFTGDKYSQEVHPFTYIHLEDRVRISRSFTRMLEEFTPINFEYRVISINGDIFHLETSSVPVEDETGKKFVMTSRDITKRKIAEEILRNTEKISVVGELAAGIAHEIRNPLTSLRGFLHLFKENCNANHEQLDLMFSEIDRINIIVSELLFLAKPKITNYKAIDLLQVLEEVLQLLNSEAALNQTTFQTKWDNIDATVYGEANHLKQVFINIIKNGLEAMDQGGILSIEIYKTPNHQIVIRFEDQGCGISKELLSKIGEPFFTTKELGTGLGLMISKKIIQDHDGLLMIESEIDKGTIVTIKLPYYDLKL